MPESVSLTFKVKQETPCVAALLHFKSTTVQGLMPGDLISVASSRDRSAYRLDWSSALRATRLSCKMLHNQNEAQSHLWHSNNRNSK